VAHTITLASASLKLIAVPGSIVEPLIALSIAWIGIENIITKSGRVAVSRSAVVFAFGLLHGLGFASVLADFGLPQSAFIIGLLSFNLGVEIGQLIIVIPIFFILRALKLSKPQFRQGFQIPVSAVISAIGIFWFFERLGLV
ncbi:MAG: HupE/UreJ family protein, partial [Pseudomonadota bacterium]|nr:HupE/UreJ family protein [Pseudomonadota bacterium]